MAAALNLSRNNDHFNGSYNSEITLSLRIMEYSISDRTSDITPKKMTGSDQSTSTQTPWKLEGELWGQNSMRAQGFLPSGHALHDPRTVTGMDFTNNIKLCYVAN